MLVTIKNLQVHYGSRLALQIKNPVEIEEGDRIGIIGSNGAGKTTLVRALLGIIPYQGQIVTSLKPEEMAAHLQFNNYVSTMPVRYVVEAMLNTSIKKDRQLQELIRFFDFEQCLGKRYQSLSGGQKQRLTIIMVMMQDAPLTFFDEVTSGLDFETRQKLMELLMKWYQGRSNTLCIVSHYYEELELLVRKLLILDQGNVIDYGDKESLFRKYCGNSIMILDASRENDILTRDYKRLHSPEHLLALSCRNEEEEIELASLLIRHNVTFKRSSSDIEIMFINAKAAYEANKEKGENGYEE